MGNLSLHFDRSEFACQCGCGFDDVSSELIIVLEDVRAHFNVPVSVTSGCRCKTHNKAIGGATNSQHTLGIAADIKLQGKTPKEVYKYLESKYPNKYGMGIYKSWVHIDVRKEKARWVG